MIIQNKIFVVNECRNVLRELMIKSVVIFYTKKKNRTRKSVANTIPTAYTWNTLVLIKHFSVGIVQYQFFMPWLEINVVMVWKVIVAILRELTVKKKAAQITLTAQEFHPPSSLPRSTKWACGGIRHPEQHRDVLCTSVVDCWCL